MGLDNVDFSLLSLNARGIRTFEKRKAIFSWLLNSEADICFYKKPTVLKKSKISGENSGKVTCSSPTVAATAGVYLYW